MKWNSKITKVEPNHLVTKGYRQEDLIGNIPFSHIVYLILKGELPSKEHGKMMDAILSATIDHGVTPPSAIAARTVASGKVPLPTAVAAGILSIGDAHGGAIEKGAGYFQDKVKEFQASDQSLEKFAADLAKQAQESHSRILGFGHRIHTDDPRTKKLFLLADTLHLTGPHIELAKALEQALAAAYNRKLPINVDGAIAAIISDMGFDWRLGKAFFLLGRVAGLTAQVYEEQTTQKPMRRIFTTECEYKGRIEQSLPKKK